MPGGTVWLFTMEMDAKSVIAFALNAMKLTRPGFYKTSGLAWWGRRTVSRPRFRRRRQGSMKAALQEPVLNKALRASASFGFGKETRLCGKAAARMRRVVSGRRCSNWSAFAAPSLREALEHKGIKPCIPGRKSCTKTEYDKRRYRRRNRIEIMFGRLKDWHRVATRYDRSPLWGFIEATAILSPFRRPPA